MATAVLVTDLTEITDCDLDTNGGTWSGITAAEGSTDPPPLEGTGWIGGIIKQADDSNSMTFSPTTAIAMSGNILRVPMMTVLKPLLKTKTLGGIQLIVSDGTNTATFNVSGGDFYIGDWELLICNPYATPDEGTAITGNVSSITMNFKILTAAKNITTTYFDWMSYGTGFYVHGGTSGDEIGMLELVAQDSYYLAIQDLKGIYRISSKFQIGDNVGTNSTYFKSSGDDVIFDDYEVDADFYELIVAGNATGVTHADLSGMKFKSYAAKFSVDFTNANITSVTLDGTIFQNGTTIDLESTTSGNGTVIDACAAVDTNGATLNNVVIKNTTEATTGSLIINSQTEAELCDNMTFQSYSNNSRYAVYVAASVTSFTMDNWQFDDPDNTTDIALHWLGTSGTLTISSVGGTNLISAGCSAETGGTVVVQTSASIDVHVEDQSSVDIADAWVYIDTNPTTGDTADIVNTQTSASGDVSTSYSGAATSATIRIRKYGYKPYVGSISLLSDSNTNVILISDPQQT